MESSSLPLPLVDGLALAEEYRRLLRPGELLCDRQGRARRLPRFFYEVPSWEAAEDLQLTPHFALSEFIDVDFREALLLRSFPRYVPCAVVHLATHLEVLRERLGAEVRIATNGGYRSPSHALSGLATPHSWATAANLYSINGGLLDSAEKIEKYARLARDFLPGIWTRTSGGEDPPFDHLHLDVGYLHVVPRDAPSEERQP